MLSTRNSVFSALIILTLTQVFLCPPSNAQVAQRTAAKPVIETLTAAPQDFPVSPYPRNLIGATQYQRNGSVLAQSVSATTKTKDDPGTTFEWYQDQLKSGGWSVQTPTAANTPQAQLDGKLYMLRASHGHTTVIVCCSKLTTPYTTITVTSSQN
jgi:hypothetical protein